MFVQQPSNKPATLGAWAIVLWIALPVIGLVLCCAGCFITGVGGAFVDGFKEGYNEGVLWSPSP
ncbi:hypothetical protein [Micromonospora sp. MA102]|uniref:hypothetical protein n=1 Tax=Micromonospora sp. MA102 TaxID=2952755 RepID=UPI0021C75AF0|nr:hypothetical protein [Micromonospora sp. MA102]